MCRRDRDICEDDERFYVFTGAKEAHILLKKGAANGWEGFSRFMEEKTGLKTIVIK